jgi:asparagine synthase (glutamine-hydrolysing)
LFDEPFADSSSIPTLLVSRLASREVKVVLSADGGDELFSGYRAYSTVLDRLRRLDRLPGGLKTTSRAGLELLPSNLIDSFLSANSMRALGLGTLGRKVHRWREMLRDTSPFAMTDVAMSHWYPDQIRQLLGSYDRPESTPPIHTTEPAIEISLRDFHHYLPGDILTKVDRTTMAVSIEGREPLLDHRLAEFAFRLPPHLRRGELGPKHILKRILYRYVPRDLVDRPKKGFGIPKIAWLKGDLKDLVEDYLSPERLRIAGLMDHQLVKRVVDDFYAGNDALVQPLWILLAFEMWRERWE